MTDYPRACSITAEGASGSLDMSALRCRFDIKQFTRQSPNLATVRITNQLPATARALIGKEYSKLSISAGYQGGQSGVIFSGNLIFGTYGRDPDAAQTDTLTTLWCGDGEYAHNYATTNTTLAAGSTPQDHVNAAMKAMQPYGVSQGFVGVDLSKPVYPRAVTLFGMARDILARVARTKNADVSYQNGQMQMVAHQQTTPGSAISLNSKSGIIGMPTQSTGGILVRCVINPQMKINTQVKINQADIQQASPTIDISGTQVDAAAQFKVAAIAADGLYKILQINASGDTRGNPWYMDLACVALGTNTPESLLFAEGGATTPGQ